MNAIANRGIAATVLLIVVGLWGCGTEEPSGPVEDTRQFRSLTDVSFPDASYGSVVLNRSRWTSSNEWKDYDTLLSDLLPDSVVDALNGTRYDSDWFSHAWAQFGSGDQATGFRINGQLIPEVNAPNSEYFYSSDHASEPSFYTDGRANIFETVIGGNIYRDTVAGDIGEISFSPELMDTVNLSGFSVTWGTSNSAADYVQISISEVGRSPGGTTTSSSRETLTIFSEDDGSESVLQSDLSNFPAGPAEIVVRRGFFATVSHGDLEITYTLSTSYSTVILLE